ncbi:MAG: NfeD family protein [Pseudomonadota bacterium]
MSEWIASNPIAAGFWAVFAGFAAFLLAKIYGLIFMRGKTVHMIGDAMVGRRGEVASWSGQEGMVSVGGELWRAFSQQALVEGDRINVKAVDGLTLKVEK